MTSEPRTERSVRDSDTVRKRAGDWILLEGDRRAVAGCLAVLTVGVVWTLVVAGVLAVGPTSSVASLFASGLTSGVITLLTIALSINQLVLSRVFGSVDTLVDRLTGSRDLRETVESIAGVPSSPNDPADFLSLIATTLTDRADGVIGAGGADWDPPERLTTALRDLAAYGESLDDHLESNTDLTSILGVILGPEYAVNMTAIRHLQNEYGASIPEEAVEELRAVEDLLESIAVVRQFYKTIAIQEDLATLSRLLVYSGMAALAAAVTVTLVYRTGSVTLPAETLPVVVSAAIGVIVTPMALFVAYILRAATVARQTVSVGPFVPPRNRG
jgi:hypothetical protein